MAPYSLPAVSRQLQKSAGSGLDIDQAYLENQFATYEVSSQLAGLRFDHYLSTPEYRGQLFTVEMDSTEAWDAMVAAGVETGGPRHLLMGAAPKRCRGAIAERRVRPPSPSGGFSPGWA